MIFNYEVFYRRFGVRLPGHLMSPTITTIDKFSFPKNSAYHYTVYDSVSSGPASDEYLFRDIKKKIAVQHILELTDFKGGPKRLSVPLVPYVRQYHMKNKRFRLFENVTQSVSDENTLVVYNYGFVSKAYRYVRSLWTEYYKWWNMEKTVWDNIRKAATESERQQFVFINIPKTLPSFSRLEISCKIFNQQVLKRFNTPEHLFLLEFWKWLDPEYRAESVIGDIPQEQLNKINIVLQDSDKFIFINLGVFNMWRYDEANPIPGQKVKIEISQFKKRFLRMAMFLMETRTANTPETPELITDEGEESNVVKPDTDSSKIINNPDPAVDNSFELEEADALDKELLDDDLTQKEKIEKYLKSLDADLEQLETFDKAAIIEEDKEKTIDEPVELKHKSKIIDKTIFNKDLNPSESVIELCDNLTTDGLMSAGEFRKFSKQAESYKDIVINETGDRLGDFITIKPEVLEIKESKKTVDRPTILDKSMLRSSLLDFDERYIKEVMKKDIASMPVNIQKAGVLITKYEIEKVQDILGAYEIHTLRLNPIEGTPSTIRFRLPVVDEDGVYKTNGVKYRMRKQRGDLPIRKTASDTVALTSYYGKTFVTRSDKKVNDYGSWLRQNITQKGIDSEDTSVTNLMPADVFDSSLHLPRTYSILAMGFKSFTAKGYNFIFDYTNRNKVFNAEQISEYEVNGSILVGHNDTDKFIVMDKHGSLIEVSGDELVPFGTIESLVGLSTNDAPVDFAQIKIYGKNIPVGLILAYKYGLQKLLDVLKADVRRVPAGQRLNLQEHEYTIVFSDETLVLSRDDELAKLILSGFREYHRATKHYSVYTFDKHNVYLNLLENNGISSRYLREIDLMDKLFVDPITKDLLIEMGEPTSFRGLLLRSAEMLLTDSHKNALDMSEMRIKGYERFSGAVYGELVQAVREHKNKIGRGNQPIELNPHAVWRAIAQDPSVNLVDEINPIENLKQQEAVTFSGAGGRMGRSMTKASRAYHRNDMGVISESTSDSSDVAINTYTSADPQFKSLRGTVKHYTIGKTGNTALLSTSALLSVGSDTDDPKRVNFVSIQHNHGLACAGYTQSAVRTGYEQVIAQRTSDLFAYAAREKGKVISKKDNGIVVEYESGEIKSIELGRRFGNASGLTIAHDVISELKAGDEFNAGDIISYNTGFFEKDILNPKNVIWKMGVTVKTALYESTQTHEDASSISKRLADKLITKTTKVKNVILSFDQEVRNIVNAGTKVEHETILCIIEDAVTSGSNLFDADSLNTLRLMSNQAPTAKVRGTIERIEVYYHGEKEDMSESLRSIANASDRDLVSRNRALQRIPFTGSVNEDFRIDGESLGLDCVVIRFYITSDISAGVGDKGVFCNQMKTVFSEVMDYKMTTESGAVIDAVFGQKSIDDRIVLSATVIGTTNTLLDIIGKKAIEIYKGKS